MIFWRKKNTTESQKEEAKEKSVPAGPDSEDAQIDGEVPSLDQQNPSEENLVESEQGVEPGSEVSSDETGWLSRLTTGLSKSTSRLGQGISDIFTKRKLDDDTLQDLEDLLISADLGPKTAAQVVQRFSAHKFDKSVDPEEVRSALAGIIADALSPVAVPLSITTPENGPFVLLICGVNGAGKTTTIGKLAHQWHRKEGRNVMIAAADTFRAAAVDQLDIWARRADVPLFKKELGADAAAVAFEAYAKARVDKADILMIDTAGRLQNKAGLMAELEKIVRVLKKHDSGIPHAVLLVLDATTGQNAHSQVKIFSEAVNLTGLIVTKLDGSARGGVVVSLAREFGLPIHAIGVGEKIEDLSPFSAQEFAHALMGAKS